MTEETKINPCRKCGKQSTLMQGVRLYKLSRNFGEEPFGFVVGCPDCYDYVPITDNYYTKPINAIKAWNAANPVEEKKVGDKAILEYWDLYNKEKKTVMALREENEQLKKKLEGMEWVRKVELDQAHAERDYWAKWSDDLEKELKKARQVDGSQVVLTVDQWAKIKNKIIELECRLSKTRDVAEGMFGITDYTKIHKHELSDWLESIGVKP